VSGPGIAVAHAAAKAVSKVREGLDEAASEAADHLGLKGARREEFMRRVNDLATEEELREGKRMTGPTQYAITESGAYHPVGQSTKELPPGMYEPVLTQEGLFLVPMAIRTDDIVLFPDAATTDVVTEIERFWEREDRFREFGLPFKRGMLLYGPPGSGKSTTLQLVSRDVIGRGGIVLPFRPDAWLPAYRAVRAVQPDIPIVTLMEDLDALLERRESSTLNLLDGAEDLQRVIFLATTNYIEKLDPRVKNRPSRFDRRFNIDHPGAEARRLYLESIADGKVEIDIARYVKDTEGMSLAHLKELFVATVIIGQNYDVAVRELDAMNNNRVHSADGVQVGQYV
jgi:energy-coupling factor transporter ATP-binding protein EcfA2